MDSKMLDASTDKLIELQFHQSRIRSAKRHNRHVLRAAERHTRRGRIMRVVRVAVSAGLILAFAAPFVVVAAWFFS